MAIRTIDPEKCVGCGTCVNTCAMDVIRLNNAPFEIEEYTPCRLGCPAGVNMRSYINELKHGRVEAAMRIIREVHPLPAVTGHVCFHPCETQCARKDVDEAVYINALERYLADSWLKEKGEPVRQLYVAKAAVVGSGPAGLAAAYDLVKLGYPVTVFESEAMLGGMLRLGIPAYRLPRDILDAQISYLRDLGVEFQTGVTIGRHLTLEALKERGYQAALFAVGTPYGRRLDIEGLEYSEIEWGLEFLRKFNLDQPVSVKERVVVVGGGNVAMDVALTARRLGAKEVHIVCLESREIMPALDEEIEQALDEGVHLHPSWGPHKVIGSAGKVTGIQFMSCTSVFDKNGRFNPCYDAANTVTIDTDMVIFSIGEAADLSCLPKDLALRSNGIIVDSLTYETSLPGVFAAGTIVTGPSTVIEAISTGKKAAISIDRYLRGQDLKAGRKLEPPTVKRPPKDGVEPRPRQEMPLRPLAEREGNFAEIKLGLDAESADCEAQRCMACGSKAYMKYIVDCMTCYSCEKDCPQSAIYVAPEPVVSGVSCWG